MAITNFTAKKVQFKIAIHGPAFAGKSTTLNYIQSHIEAETIGNLQALKGATETTLSFEFTPADATLLDDFSIQFDLLTVPGKVMFNAPRKLVLRDADGVLFIADSDWTKTAENVASFKNLEETLKKSGTDIDEIPLVLAYNKRDLAETAPVSYLDFVLNNRRRRVPSFATKAATGENVFAALRTLCETVIQRFLENNPSASAEAVVS